MPWGQDRLVPIFLATLAIRQKSPRITFESAARMLDAFAMQQGGTQYRRLVGAFQRIFGQPSSSAPTRNVSVRRLSTVHVLIS